LVEEVVLSDQGMTTAHELKALAGRPIPAGTGLARVLRDRQPLHAPSLLPGFPLLSKARLPQTPASAALVPLTARDRCLGVLALFAERANELGGAVVDLAEQVAGRVAVALTSAMLRQSVAELESAQQMARFRDDVLAALSHDTKTPLAVIAGSIETMQAMGEQLPPETTRRLFEGVANQTTRLRRLVMQFLDYTRLESGRSVLVTPSVMALGPAVDAVITSYGDPDDFGVDIPPDLPPVVADPDRVDQALSNVIGNALKFSPSGRPVEVIARRAGGEVEVAVVDHGPGISPPDLAGLFQKFSRGAASEGTEGTGLGLYMTQALMTAQGGRITVASKVGEGSRFTLHFPAVTEGDDT
jgi:two-component system sensor histidine kinase KdpD